MRTPLMIPSEAIIAPADDGRDDYRHAFQDRLQSESHGAAISEAGNPR